FSATNGALRDLTETERAQFESPDYNHTLTVYAKWAPNEYRAIFHLNDKYETSVHAGGNGTTEATVTLNGVEHKGVDGAVELPVYFDHSILISNYMNNTIRQNSELPIPANLERTGYAIDNGNPWARNADGSDPAGNIFRQSVVHQVVGNVDYYARWDAEQWEVRFSTYEHPKFKPQAGYNPMPHLNDQDSIDAVDPISITFDDPTGAHIDRVTTLRTQVEGEADLIVGYNFDKWYVDSTLESTVSFDPLDTTNRLVLDSDMITRNDVTVDRVEKTITLYPSFVGKEYQIALNSNYTSYEGGEGSDVYDLSPITARYNDLVIIGDPSLHGYADGMRANGFEFLGWSLSPIALAGDDMPEYPVNGRQDVTVTRLGDGSSTQAINLYAHWRKERFYIQYETDTNKFTWDEVTHGVVPNYYDANGTEGHLVLPAVGDSDAPKMTGADFLGWTITFYTNKDFTGDIASTSTTTEEITGDILNSVPEGKSVKITSNWKLIKGQLIVSPNGGVGEKVTVDIEGLDTYVTIPQVSYTWEGYKLDHFSNDANDRTGIILNPGSSIRIIRNSEDDDYYVYAIWKKNINAEPSDDKGTGTFYDGSKTSVGNREYKRGTVVSGGGG
ncbi:MAG: hypothetical protein IJ593_09105, partial [Lachnospiraceae bacterium]|nr:hypothetical protein [Lachnospiraceae bacterium]